MKKKLTGLAMVLAVAMTGLLPASASALPAETDVTGVVTDSGVPVANASVEAKCGATTKTDTTNMSGTYLVSFTAAECPPGSTVMIKATKGSKSGNSVGTVVGLTTKLNVGLINVSIPEMGLIGALLATGAGVGAITFARRRYAQQGSSL